MIREKLKNIDLSPAERNFIADVAAAALQSVGYGFMQQICEWVWQDHLEIQGKPNTAWGPEYFNKRIRELEEKLNSQPERIKCPSPTPSPTARKPKRKGSS
jgi:hypothetical protein